MRSRERQRVYEIGNREREREREKEERTQQRGCKKKLKEKSKKSFRISIFHECMNPSSDINCFFYLFILFFLYVKSFSANIYLV